MPLYVRETKFAFHRRHVAKHVSDRQTPVGCATEDASDLKFQQSNLTNLLQRLCDLRSELKPQVLVGFAFNFQAEQGLYLGKCAHVITSFSRVARVSFHMPRLCSAKRACSCIAPMEQLTSQRSTPDGPSPIRSDTAACVSATRIELPPYSKLDRPKIGASQKSSSPP